MKKIMITAALVTSLITIGFSQDKMEGVRNGKPGFERTHQERQSITSQERAQRSTDALEKKLNLTAEQKSKVYILNLERAERMDKTMKADREFRKGQMEKQKSYLEDADKKLNEILSAEQQKSYADMKEQSRERMKARRPAGARNKVK